MASRKTEDDFEIDIGEIGKMFGVDLNLKGIKIKKNSKHTSDREVYLEKICLKQSDIIIKLKKIAIEQRDIIKRQAEKIVGLETKMKESIITPSPAPVGSDNKNQGGLKCL